MSAEVEVRDVRLRLQPQRQLLHFLRSHGNKVFMFYAFNSSEVVQPQVSDGVTPQVYDAGEEVAVQDGVQALRVRQRVDIGTGGGGHMRRKQAAAEDRDSEEQERDITGTKHVYLFANGSELQPYMARSQG